VCGWYSDNSVFLEDAGVYLRPGAYSVVVLEESPCPRRSSRTNFQVLVLVLVFESQVLDNNTDYFIENVIYSRRVLDEYSGIKLLG